MLTLNEQILNEILTKTAESLDISPSKYKEAIERFQSLKQHLLEGIYPNTHLPPEVYMQGSFKLGTVIRPYKEGSDADYDIDAVCRLDLDKARTQPETLKIEVGEEVKSYSRKNGMKRPIDKRRCWALEYSPDSNNIGFHIDILPCLYDCNLSSSISRHDPTLEQFANTTIALPNRDDTIKPARYDWRSGNPLGYLKWFWSVNCPGFVIFEKEQKRLIFENNRGIYSSEAAVYNELVHTPLQRVIQILKRHRDIYFAGHKWEKHKPISIIITTLAAKLYEGNASRLQTVYSAFDYIVKQLSFHAALIESQKLSGDISKLKIVQRVGNKWYIPNPVNPHNPGDPDEKGENFADRWHEDNHAGARAFFEWITKLIKDLETVYPMSNYENGIKYFFSSLGLKYQKDKIPHINIIEKNNDDYHTVEIRRDKVNKPWAL